MRVFARLPSSGWVSSSRRDMDLVCHLHPPFNLKARSRFTPLPSPPMTTPAPQRVRRSHSTPGSLPPSLSQTSIRNSRSTTRRNLYPLLPPPPPPPPPPATPATSPPKQLRPTYPMHSWRLSFRRTKPDAMPRQCRFLTLLVFDRRAGVVLCNKSAYQHIDRRIAIDILHFPSSVTTSQIFTPFNVQGNRRCVLKRLRTPPPPGGYNHEYFPGLLVSDVRVGMVWMAGLTR